MTSTAREAFLSKYREFGHTQFPELGYSVDGLAEADTTLGGLLSHLEVPGRHISIETEPIIGADLIDAALALCHKRRGSREAAELESYVRQLVELEKDMRDLVKHCN